MPHKLRKTRKMRGSRTCGWGRVGQHRKSSSKSYRKAGRHKHLWSYVLKYEPNYFGKKGFTSPQSLRPKGDVINVGDLEELIERLKAVQQLEERDGMAFLDLGKLGYAKLLGEGDIDRPVLVKVASFSKSALEKIEAAGGRVLTPSAGSPLPHGRR